MVLKNEEKVDVFADFHLNRQVGDNEDRLNRREEDERHQSSQFVNDNVFAEFKLDEIIRKHEDRLRREVEEKQRAEAEDEEGARISNVDRGDPTSPWSGSLLPKIPGLKALQRSVSADTGTEAVRKQDDGRGWISEAVRKQDDGRGWSSERAESASATLRGLFQRTLRPPPMVDRVLSGGSKQSTVDGYGERDNMELGDDGESTSATTENTKWRYRKRKKHTNTSRSGTTVTAPATIQESEYDSSEAEFCPDDVEEAGNGTYDNYNGGDICPMKKKNAITISKTGMPVGGMVATEEGARQSDYHWVSPHSSDRIFHDFDIDAIAKDYDRLARRMNVTNLDGNPVDELDDVDEVENELITGIKMRYQNLFDLWVHNFPRTHVITFRIFVPMFFIILATVFLGKLLALLEWTTEIESNNAMLRSRHQMVNPYEERISVLSAIPTLCFDYYTHQKFPEYGLSNNSIPSAISTIIDSQGSVDQIDDFFVGDETSISAQFAKLSFPPIRSEIDPDPEVVINEIDSFMSICKDIVNEITLKVAEEAKEELESASQDELTFHWMRCWNTTELYSVNPIIPNKDQLAASWNQAEFFEENWKKNQMDLYEKYKIEYNCPPEDSPRTNCHNDAYEKSLEEATGREMCSTNTAASAWFWFVFMTTVGYGNVSPVTWEGRLMVGVLGLFTIPIWAILLYIAGKVLGIVIDDLFRRCNWRFMTRNLPSVFVWAFISTFWILMIAEFFVLTQNYADDPEEYRFSPFGLRDRETARENVIQLEDAYWFSYISVLTVGKYTLLLKKPVVTSFMS